MMALMHTTRPVFEGETMRLIVLVKISMLIVISQVVVVDSWCDLNGEFGTTCKYKCRCNSDQCDRRTGECPYGCQPGWMGPACQFRIAETSLPLWATDGDDRTCYNQTFNESSISITGWFTRPQSLTFIYMESSRTSELGQLQVEYTVKGETYNHSCPHAKNVSHITTEDGQLELFCPEDRLVEAVTVSGVGVSRLCAFEISGGRALTLQPIAPENGTNQSIECRPGLCLSWRIVPYSVSIDELVIHRNEKETEGSTNEPHSFVIQLHSDTDEALYTYPHTGVLSREPLPVVLPRVVGATKLHVVYASDTNRSSMVRVELFGNCIHGKFGQDCQHNCNCDNGASCSFSGQCVAECYPGHYGEHCEKACRRAFWGPDCKMSCHPKCQVTGCGPKTGLCWYECSNKTGHPDCDLSMRISVENEFIQDKLPSMETTSTSRAIQPYAIMGAAILAGALIILGSVFFIVLSVARCRPTEEKKERHKRANETAETITQCMRKTVTSGSGSNWGSNICDHGEDVQELTEMDSICFTPTQAEDPGWLVTAAPRGSSRV